MTKEQEALYNMYMKLSKKELAEMLAIINTTNNISPTTAPLQDGVFPPLQIPMQLPPYKPMEVWYTTKTNTKPEYPRFNSISVS